MSPARQAPRAEIAPDLARVAARRALVVSPTIRYRLGPGDRALVAPGDPVIPGMAILERTPDAELVDAGRLDNGRGARPGRQPARPESAGEEASALVWAEDDVEQAEPRPGPNGPMGAKTSQAAREAERRSPPFPGKWWIGGDERRGKPPKGRQVVRVGGTLLYEARGHWYVAAGERHLIVESPVAGVVREAQNAVELTIQVEGAALPAAIAAGESSRGYLDVPRLADGELWVSALDMSRAGAVVVAGSRISAQAISRARAMSVRGLIAGSVGEGELRDLGASEIRQRASLVSSTPFAILAFDGHGRRPIATPVLSLLAALTGREVAIVTDPPLLVFDTVKIPLPEVPPDWIRVRCGPHAGREGRWLKSAGMYRFRGGIHLEGAVVRFVDDTETTTVPVTDLERLVF